MAWQSDFSIEKLFVSRSVFLSNKNTVITLQIPTIADHFHLPFLNGFFQIFNIKKANYVKIFKLLKKEIITDLQLCVAIMQYAFYEELKLSDSSIRQTLDFVFKDYTVKLQGNKIMLNDSLTLDEELFDYVLYVLRSAEGMKLEPPRTFKTDAEKAKYLKRLEQEEQIRQIKATGIKHTPDATGDKNSILLSMNIILKAYPQYTFEDLFNMTFCQVSFLQINAGKILKYDVEKAAYSAGNIKKLKGFWE